MNPTQKQFSLNRGASRKQIPISKLRWLCPIVVCLMTANSWSAGPIQVLKRPGTNSIEKVHCLAYSPDGKLLAVGSSAPSLIKGDFPGRDRLPEGTIELWDLDAGKLRSTLRQSAKSKNGDSYNQVGALTFSPDGKWLIGSDHLGYTLWEVATGKQKFKWRCGMSESLSAAWSPDGKWIGLPTMVHPDAPSYDSTPHGVALVEAETGKAKMFFPVKIGYPRAARFSPDGKLLVTAGHDCTVRVFDTVGMTNIFSDHAETTMFTVGFSPDGRYFVAGPSRGGVLLIYEVGSDGGKAVIRKKGESRSGGWQAHPLEFTPDGRFALCSSSRGIKLWDATGWASFKMLERGPATLSSDGKRIALAHQATPETIEIWSLVELEKTLVAPRR